MALIVLDASVLIGLERTSDPHHEAAERAMRRYLRDDLVIPASVFAEILVAPFRSGRHAVDAVDQLLHDLAIRIEPVTAAVARTAARIRSRHRSIRLPDAFVLALGEELGADVVLTADDRWTGIQRRVKLVQTL